MCHVMGSCSSFVGALSSVWKVSSTLRKFLHFPFCFQGPVIAEKSSGARCLVSVRTHIGLLVQSVILHSFLDMSSELEKEQYCY